MVDKDLLDSMKSGGESKKKKKKKKDEGGSSSSDSSGSSSSTSGGEPFELEDEARLEPDGVVVSDGAEDIAEGASLNNDYRGNSLSQYRKRQVKECKELYDDLKKNVREYGGDLTDFTAVMQSIIMNLAQNRHGIAMTLMNHYDMDKSEAQDYARKITNKAGEPEAIDWTIHQLTKDLME
jgi:hypothetical protein